LHALYSLSELLVVFLDDGARLSDMSGIFCPSCDFRKASGNVQGVNFKNAILSKANFNKLNLSGASFTDAFLQGTTFYGSDLDSADFGQSPSNTSTAEWAARVGITSMTGLGFAPTPVFSRNLFPHFDCASLANAHFANSSFFVSMQFPYEPSSPRSSSQGKYAALTDGATFGNADLDKADFATARVTDLFWSTNRLTLKDAQLAAMRLFPIDQGGMNQLEPLDLEWGITTFSRGQYVVFMSHSLKGSELDSYLGDPTADPQNISALGDFIEPGKNWKSAVLPEDVRKAIEAGHVNGKVMSGDCSTIE
jgi:uncharacterized protein YjbI with pentapeptide repeats